MRVQALCTSSSGDQPFTITWHKNGKPLIGDKSVEISGAQSFSSILTIHNITSKHNGNYSCQISNTAGVVEYEAGLSVAGKKKAFKVLHQK